MALEQGIRDRFQTYTVGATEALSVVIDSRGYDRVILKNAGAVTLLCMEINSTFGASSTLGTNSPVFMLADSRYAGNFIDVPGQEPIRVQAQSDTGAITVWRYNV